MSSWGPVVKTYKGMIANQEAFYCTRPQESKVTFEAPGCHRQTHDETSDEGLCAVPLLTHATAKWAWLAEQAGPGRHVLRLSYGRSAAPGAVTPGPAPDSRLGGLDAAPRSDDELFRAALADASALLAVPVGARDVADWDVVRWAGALPFASLGHRQRVAAVRSVCAADGTLAVVGGWLSGNGLAAIVADTPRRVQTLLS